MKQIEIPSRNTGHLKVGLLGGSFNPAHEGHHYISEVALRALGLDQVWWLVSPQNPLKSSQGMAPLEERLASAKAAARAPQIRAFALETHFGTQYTADTLQRIQHRYPRHRFVWLMGADNLLQFHHWQHWRHIMHTMPIAVFDRAPYSKEALFAPAARRYEAYRLSPSSVKRLVNTPAPAWAFMRIPTHPASSTLIRAGERHW